MWTLILGLVETLFGGWLKSRASTAEQLGQAKEQAATANDNVTVLEAEAKASVSVPVTTTAMEKLLEEGKL